MLLFYINSILMFYPKICFRKQVTDNGMVQKVNMNCRGNCNCYDNAVTESIFNSLKNEKTYRKNY